MSKKHSLKLQGYMVAQTPIIHIRKTGNKPDGTPISWSIKENVPCVDDEGNAFIKEVPYIQGSSVRGNMRDCMANVIAGDVEGMLSKEAATRLWNGGQLEVGNQLRIDERRDITARCLDVGLFGGIADNMFPSKIRFSPLYPIVDSTIKAGIVPLFFDQFKTPEKIVVKDSEGKVVKTLDTLRATCILTRRDELLDGAEDLISYLSDEGMDGAEEYIRKGMEVQASKADSRAKGEKGESKTIAKHYSVVEVIPAGTKLFAEIHILNATMAEIGLALKTLEEFFARPYLGGRSAAGYGKVSMEMSCVFDGEETWEDYPDFITVNDRGETVINYRELDWVKDAEDAYNQWKEGMTAEKLDATFGRAEKLAAAAKKKEDRAKAKAAAAKKKEDK